MDLPYIPPYYIIEINKLPYPPAFRKALKGYLSVLEEEQRERDVGRRCRLAFERRDRPKREHTSGDLRNLDRNKYTTRLGSVTCYRITILSRGPSFVP